jgi:hypothetical protein
MERNMSEALTALHEAAHAVVGEALHIPVVEVTIIPNFDEGTAGHCIYVPEGAIPDTFEEPWPGWDDLDEWGDEADRRAISALAGYEAQKRAGAEPDELEVGCGSDRWEADGHIYSAEQDQHYRSRAGELVARHWSIIEKVAEALIQGRTLTGDQVRAAISAGEAAIKNAEGDPEGEDSDQK